MRHQAEAGGRGGGEGDLKAIAGLPDRTSFLLSLCLTKDCYVTHVRHHIYKTCTALL